MTKNETWDCQNCGKKEISSNFCPECGMKKTELKGNTSLPENNNQLKQDTVKKLVGNKKIVGIAIGGILVALILCIAIIRGQEKNRIAEEAKRQEEAAKKQEEVERLKQELAQEKEARQQQEIERLKQELAQKEKEEEIKKEDEKKKETKNAVAKAQKRKEKQWSSKSPNPMSWNNAIDYCNNLSENGHDDWRLPTITELRTVIKNCDGSQAGGSCKLQGDSLSRDWWNDTCHCSYQKNNKGYYSKLGDNDKVSLWSSSIRSDRTSNAWNVNFASAYIDDSRKGSKNYVRCVR